MWALQRNTQQASAYPLWGMTDEFTFACIYLYSPSSGPHISENTDKKANQQSTGHSRITNLFIDQKVWALIGGMSPGQQEKNI